MVFLSSLQPLLSLNLFFRSFVVFHAQSLALMETQENSNEDSQEESDYNEEEDSDEIQTQEIDYGHITEDNFVISKTVKGHTKPFIEEISTEKRNSVKKNKKGVASKNASQKRKR